MIPSAIFYNITDGIRLIGQVKEAYDFSKNRMIQGPKGNVYRVAMIVVTALDIIQFFDLIKNTQWADRANYALLAGRVIVLSLSFTYWPYDAEYAMRKEGFLQALSLTSTALTKRCSNSWDFTYCHVSDIVTGQESFIRVDSWLRGN